MSDEVDLDALHEGIVSGLRETFPEAALPTIGYYAHPGEKITVPAVFFELDGCGPASDTGGDIGTGQFNTTLEFSAYVIVTSRGKGAAQLAVRKLALALATAILGKRWGCPITPAKITTCEPAEFISAPSREYCCYRVAWTHDALVGTSVWDADGIIPDTIYVGITPDTGPDHIDDYKAIS